MTPASTWFMSLDKQHWSGDLIISQNAVLCVSMMRFVSASNASSMNAMSARRVSLKLSDVFDAMPTYFNLSFTSAFLNRSDGGGVRGVDDLGVRVFEPERTSFVGRTPYRARIFLFLTPRRKDGTAFTIIVLHLKAIELPFHSARQSFSSETPCFGPRNIGETIRPRFRVSSPQSRTKETVHVRFLREIKRPRVCPLSRYLLSIRRKIRVFSESRSPPSCLGRQLVLLI